MVYGSNSQNIQRTEGPYKTPIFPIQKPHSEDYRLVHDLRAINSIVDTENPTYFALKYRTRQKVVHNNRYLYIQNQDISLLLPTEGNSIRIQGYHRDTWRVLANDLQRLYVQSTVIQYVDDLLICSPTKDQCEKDSLNIDSTGRGETQRE